MSIPQTATPTQIPVVDLHATQGSVAFKAKHQFFADENTITLPLRRGCYESGRFARYFVGACTFRAASQEGLKELAEFLLAGNPVRAIEWFKSSNGGFIDGRELTIEEAMDKLGAHSPRELELTPRGSWHPNQECRRDDNEIAGTVEVRGGVLALSANTVAQFLGLPNPRDGAQGSAFIADMLGDPSSPIGRTRAADWWRIGPGGGDGWQDNAWFVRGVLPLLEKAQLSLEKVVLNYGFA